MTSHHLTMRLEFRLPYNFSRNRLINFIIKFVRKDAWERLQSTINRERFHISYFKIEHYTCGAVIYVFDYLLIRKHEVLAVEM